MNSEELNVNFSSSSPILLPKKAEFTRIAEETLALRSAHSAGKILLIMSGRFVYCVAFVNRPMQIGWMEILEFRMQSALSVAESIL